jgi:hypothetical protein
VPTEKPSIFGSIRITKKIRESEITWAHGNPTFCFVVEGTDNSGIYHRYEDAVVFRQGGYTLDGDGYAVLNLTLTSIPLGNYSISEKKVLRYSPCGLYADTENAWVTSSGGSTWEAGARLSEAAPDAAVTMVNRKTRYDGYSHTDFVKNTVPIIFED